MVVHLTNKSARLLREKQKAMQTVENIIKATKPNAIVKGENMVKGMYGKRQIVVNYDKSQDLYNVWAFTLKGTSFTKEQRADGVFISLLKETIDGLM